MIACCTDGKLGTSRFHTEWHTFFSLSTFGKVALFIGGTIIIGCAFDFNASNIFISLETRRTVANCCVEFNFAESSGATNCTNARINAFL